MKWISGMKTGLALAAAMLLLPAAVWAQQATTEVEEPTAIAMQTGEEADRETLRRFIAREDVQRVARLADVDLEHASAGILALEGEHLSRAANQARAAESQLGAADVITINATTLIIILLVILLIIVIAGS
ncbi:MAG TPA: hypothetical protein VFH11_00590 [Gemmatimonadota bacterium]|nr:hypothetical protein [Gemmatimonadota bacterium]